MARGLLTGLVWGALLGGMGLAGLSVTYPAGPVIGTTPPNAGTEAPIGTIATGEEAGVQIGVTSDATADVVVPVALADPTDPADTQIPAEIGSVDQIEVGDVAAIALEALSDGQGPEISAMTDDAAAPDVASPASGVGGPMNEATPEAMPEFGAQPAMPDALTEADMAIDAPEGGQGVMTSPAADVILKDVVPDPADAALAETPPETQTPPAAQPIVPPRSTTPDAGSGSPGEPAGQIGDMAEGVTTNRLPSIASGDDTAPVSAEIVTEEGALFRNAESFDTANGRPMMAVILMDVGAERTQLGDLKNLPFPISFVVDAGASDAAEAIQFYRAAGAEVVVSVLLPQGATPSDVEVTLSAYAPLLSDAVAMMAQKESSFQTLGASARQVAVVLQETGHGLITVPQGLNTGHKSARKEGVAVGLIFRELDNDGQSGAIIRRFMDNAAFKARQNKGVILLGRARIETIQALIEWSLGSRAESVALVPVSAVLAPE